MLAVSMRMSTTLGHRVAGVDDEIHDDLFELAAIGSHRCQHRRPATSSASTCFANQPAQHVEQILHDLVGIQHDRLRAVPVG